METASLEQPIAELLQQIPETWAELDHDGLSERHSQALSHLVAAELVEHRWRLKLWMVNHPLVIEGTVTATGEYGLVEALKPLAAATWEEWRTAFVAWREGESNDTPPFHCESLGPTEWRLTTSGVLACKDLEEGRARVVSDFVLRRGPLKKRPPVRGHGRLARFSKTSGPLAETQIGIANWDQGAAAFASAFSQFVERLRSTPAGDQGSRHEGRHVETEQQLKRYLSDRAASYDRLVPEVLQGDSDALRRFRNLFGPTAFARHVSQQRGKGDDDDELGRIKTAVQQTTTYRERIKPVLRGRPPKGWTRNPTDEEFSADEIVAELNRQLGGGT